MKTAVILLNYNRPELTATCLRHLERSTVPLRIVVIDNASTKGDIRAVCAQHPSVRLIHNTENLGFGRGNNVGIKWALEHTDCKYLLILNNDAYIEPGTIAILESFLDTHPHYAGCSPRIVFADMPEVIWFGGGHFDWARGGARSDRIFKRHDGEREPRESPFITGCAMMLRREAMLASGGFDPLFFMYVEDIDFCARLKSMGYRLAYVPESLLAHDVYGSLKSEGQRLLTYESLDNERLEFYLYHAVCNHLIVARRHTRGIAKLRAYAYLALKYASWCAKYALNLRFSACMAMARSLLRFLRVRARPFTSEIA